MADLDIIFIQKWRELLNGEVIGTQLDGFAERAEPRSYWELSTSTFQFKLGKIANKLV